MKEEASGGSWRDVGGVLRRGFSDYTSAQKRRMLMEYTDWFKEQRRSLSFFSIQKNTKEKLFL
jgi:hypothetical protein